ncbi:MAG: hypothetical protein H7039_20435 [Bryobacteraceae bacterium]|nr:hypothetical protein [Bryobacteraceae bacterium]
MSFLVPVLFALTLPHDIGQLIGARYPDWKPSRVATQITTWFSEYRFSFEPALVRADFNDDGHQDWAALILSRGQQILVVAMGSGSGGWNVLELSSTTPDPFTYLLLYARGDKDFDFKTLKKFRHSANSLGLMHFRGTPLQFTWKKGGGFEQKLSLSDEELENQ